MAADRNQLKRLGTLAQLQKLRQQKAASHFSSAQQVEEKARAALNDAQREVSAIKTRLDEMMGGQRFDCGQYTMLCGILSAFSQTEHARQASFDDAASHTANASNAYRRADAEAAIIQNDLSQKRRKFLRKEQDRSEQNHMDQHNIASRQGAL